MHWPLPGVRWLRRGGRAIATIWLSHRIPPEGLRIRLHRRRLFILPTRLGYTFGLTLALLLLGSLNYGTSLGFVVTFLLVGTGALAMYRTVRNLDGLELVFRQPPPVFAGETLRLPVQLHSTARPHWGVRLADGGALHHIAAGAPVDGAFEFPTQARGRFHPPRLRVSASWPLGLLNSWSWVWPRIEALIYPAAIDHGLPWPARTGPAGQTRRPTPDDSDFAGLRPYQPGDSPRRIAWRALARTDETLVKTFAGPTAGHYWFDWAMLATLAPEARLQQLCVWILRADRAGLRYGLALPSQCIGPATGPAQRRRCLEALALVGDDAEAAA